MSVFALKIHQDLPQGVHPYPTLKGKRRFEALQAFNAVIGAYVAIHKLFMPLIVWALQTDTVKEPLHIGVWYLYHILLGGLMSDFFRKRSFPYLMAYCAWFAVGFLPPAIFHSFIIGGEFAINWQTISGVLCYGGSLLFTCFLLYRLRMPTTAYLYGLEGRLMPKWRYALPYAGAGLVVSSLRFF